MKKAIYPGSFNPFHIGHMDILQQALNMFDSVVVAIGNNTAKQPMHADSNNASLHRRLVTIRDRLKGMKSVEVIRYDGLLRDCLYDYNASWERLQPDLMITHIIRGLRSGHDLEAEIALRKTMSDIAPSFDFVYFVPSNPNLYHISSTMIRELNYFDPKASEKYIVV